MSNNDSLKNRKSVESHSRAIPCSTTALPDTLKVVDVDALALLQVPQILIPHLQILGIPNPKHQNGGRLKIPKGNSKCPRIQCSSNVHPTCRASMQGIPALMAWSPLLTTCWVAGSIGSLPAARLQLDICRLPQRYQKSTWINGLMEINGFHGFDGLTMLTNMLSSLSAAKKQHAKCAWQSGDSTSLPLELPNGGEQSSYSLGALGQIVPPALAKVPRTIFSKNCFLKLQQDQHHSCLNRTPYRAFVSEELWPSERTNSSVVNDAWKSGSIQGSMPESNQAKLNKNPSSSKSKGLKDKEMVGSSVFHLAQKVKTRFIPPSARGW